MNRFIQKIAAWVQNADQNRIIGISGHGAAGKTTFSHLLLKELQTTVNYLNTDPYIVDSSIRKYTVIDYTYKGESHRFKMTACHPAAHHIPALERDIRMLKEGMDLRTMDTHYAPSEILSSQNKLTIVEGMSVAFTNPELFDLLIYFYTDSQTELKRRFGRDIEERGTDLDYLKKSHHERRRQYDVFMHPYSENYNVIIKSTKDSIIVEKNTFEF